MAPRDDRDERTWVVYELTPQGEALAAAGKLGDHFQTLFREDCPEVFVPYLSYPCEGCLTLFNVMEGYSFVASGLDERLYLSVVYQSPFLKGVLHSPGGPGVAPALMTVTDKDVTDLRRQLCEMFEVNPGMEVEITQGLCKGLIGSVLGVSDEYVNVLISLRTLRTIRTVPRFAILPIGEISNE